MQLRTNKTCFWAAVSWIFFNLSISLSAAGPPAITAGVLDLRSWNFKKDGPVELSGKWKFYWSEHLSFEEIVSSDHLKPIYISVPGSWNSHVINGRKIKGKGYGTYHLKLLLDENNRHLALKLLDMATSYRLFVNGQELDTAGLPHQKPDLTRPFYHPKVVNFFNNTGQADILVHVSNFHHWQGGMWEPLLLGTPDQLRAYREHKLIVTFFVLGSISIIGIYHFCLFYFRPKDLSNLYFGLFCLLIAVRLLFTGERYIIELFPAVSYAFMLKTIYISFYLCVPAFTMYACQVFKNKISYRNVSIILFCGISFSLFTLIMPSSVFTYSMPVYQALTIAVLLYGIKVIFSAIAEKQKGSYLFAAGILILFFTVANDILYTRQLINTWHLLPFGMLFFIVSQSVLISRKFSMAFSLLEGSESRYRSLIEHSSDGICIVQDGTIAYSNSAFLALMKETEENIVRQPFLKFIHPDDRDLVIERYNSGRKIQGRHSVKGINSAGDVYDLEFDATIINWQGKQGILVLVRDITEYKKTQELLIQSEKMLSVGGLAAGMAHEINNPLAGMIQNADLMKHRLGNIETPANQKAAEELGIRLSDIKAFMEKRDIFKMIHAITSSGKQAADIITNMLSFAKKGEASFSSHPPELLLERALELAKTDYDLKKQYDFKNIEIIKQYEPNLPLVACEKSKIQQVLLNLFRNGAYAMREKSKETKVYRPIFIIRLSTEEKMLHMEIEDNGTGMDEQTRKRVFEPFFTTKPQGDGTGLGLSVSYFIITKNHGGSMDVVSEAGKGTNFIIRLPVEGTRQI